MGLHGGLSQHQDLVSSSYHGDRLEVGALGYSNTNPNRPIVQCLLRYTSLFSTGEDSNPGPRPGLSHTPTVTGTPAAFPQSGHCPARGGSSSIVWTVAECSVSRLETEIHWSLDRLGRRQSDTEGYWILGGGSAVMEIQYCLHTLLSLYRIIII